MNTAEKELKLSELSELIGSVKAAKESVSKTMHGIYKDIESDSVGDWFVEFCAAAERLIKAAEWEREKIGGMKNDTDDHL